MPPPSAPASTTTALSDLLAQWTESGGVTRKLAVAAALGAVAGVGTLLVVQSLSKRRSIRRLKSQVSEELFATGPSQPGTTATSAQSARSSRTAIPEELIREQLSRNYAFFGEEAMKKVRGSFVVVVGVGGVGSHAAHMLMRSGVERIRVIDFDQVTLSSLNRHAVARHSDVGTPKVSCLAKHCREIAPHVSVEVVMELFNLQSAPRLLAGNPDYVLDCIDNIQTKVELIDYCVKNGIRVLASMGAGAKADPSRIQIADISDTFEDPLARVTRKGLRVKGVEGGVPVVYSTERPGDVKLLPLEEAKVDEATDFAVLPNFRSRILPVLGTLPALFGCTMASYVITELAGYKLDPLAIKLRTKTYEKMLKDIKMQSKARNDDDVKLSVSDVGFILEEIWHGKSAVSGSLDKDKITLTRWNAQRPFEMGNIVCLTRKEAAAHAGLDPAQVAAHYGHDAVRDIERRLQGQVEALKWREP
ncbi:hypothetical protein DFJ73DRAFT_635816 [Zopfochytrium polystomum]|nr:hypothetical protein DFJ73DRAFT_635816 [Zopfochytrium polystomum]